jgi:hypothetical protein
MKEAMLADPPIPQTRRDTAQEQSIAPWNSTVQREPAL